MKRRGIYGTCLGVNRSVNKIWKKPKNENYHNMSQVSTSFLGTNTAASLRMSHSKRSSRRGKLRDTLRVSNSGSFTKKLSKSRKTIYIDAENNIVNPVTNSIIQKKTPLRNARNPKLPSNLDSSDLIIDNNSSTYSGNESSMFDVLPHSPKMLPSMKYQSIIPEHEVSDYRPNKSNKFKGRFKSVSPIRE